MIQKHKIKLIIISILLYIFMLLANLPAAHIIHRITLPKNVSLQGVDGSIWQGQISKAVINGIPLKNIQWDINFLPLLIGSVSADIKVSNARIAEDVAFSGVASFSIASQKIKLDDSQLQLPTDLVMAKLPLPIPVNANGRFKLDLDYLVYSIPEKQCYAMAGKGQWINASVEGLNGFIDFGNFDATLNCPDNQIEIKIDPQNRLNMDVVATVNAKGKIKAKGRFKLDPSLPKDVQQAAILFGTPDAQGYYSISM